MPSRLSATGGSAFLNGGDVTNEPKRALADVGAVVETPEFYPYLTPVETLEYIGTLRGMTKGAIQRRTQDVLETVKMGEWKDQRIGKFSKGMKQRIAIAQAILHEPSVIILDEPTSGLDPRGMVEVREILKDLKKQDYTIFMSSHLLNEVQEVCDEVALIDRGRLIRQGSVEELVNAANVRRMEIKVMDPVDRELWGKIYAVQGVGEIRTIAPNHFVLILNGGDEAQARLLTDLQALGLRVVSFKESGGGLESMYMSLITESR